MTLPGWLEDWFEDDDDIAIKRLARFVNERTKRIMTQLDDLNAKLDTLTADLSDFATSLQTTLDDLKAEIQKLQDGTVDLTGVEGVVDALDAKVADLKSIAQGSDPGPQA